jgi:hypothetical protein
MTFFFWDCQFTIDPYVKMFHINEYHLTGREGGGEEEEEIHPA